MSMTLKEKIAEITSWYSEFDDTKSNNSLSLADKILSLINRSLPRVDAKRELLLPNEKDPHMISWALTRRNSQKDYRDKLKQMFK